MVVLDTARIVLKYFASSNALPGIAEEGVPTSWQVIENWEDYHVTAGFLTPCDACSFTIGTDLIDNQFYYNMACNTPIQLVMQLPDNTERVIMSGYIDRIGVPGDSGGSKINVTARSFLRDYCDGGADPSNT